MDILAIESSCDETAAAVVRDGRIILSNAVASQIETHALYGGVVPEIASRAHTEAITPIVREALDKAEKKITDIDAIAVTNRPGLIGALLVGVSFAKGLAYANGLPLVPVHHIRGHVAANYTCYNGIDAPLLEPPFTALVMSGGHTSLLDVKGYTDYTCIGATRDDAAGEAFDKVARLMGLAYPGGAKMDRLASLGNPKAISFPEAHVKDSPYDFSFSGLKTAAINHLHGLSQKGLPYAPEDMAASFTAAVCKTLEDRVEKLFCAPEFTSKKLVLAGGVSANSHIRKALGALCKAYGVALYLPPLPLCGDNGVMIAAQGYYEFVEKTANFRNLALNAYATADVGQGADEC